MALATRDKYPSILTANSLVDGAVVYHSAAGWTPHLNEARVATDEVEFAVLQDALASAEAIGDVIEPELIRITLGGPGEIQPNHYRDRIRALGPTVRTDLGPQSRGEHRHVSL